MQSHAANHKLPFVERSRRLSRSTFLASPSTDAQCRSEGRGAFKPCATGDPDGRPLPSDNSVKKLSVDDFKERLEKAKEYRSQKKSGADLPRADSSPAAGLADDRVKDLPANKTSEIGVGTSQENKSEGNIGERNVERVVQPQRVAPEPERPATSDRRLSTEDFQARYNAALKHKASKSYTTAPSFRSSAAPDADASAVEEVDYATAKKRSAGSAEQAANFLQEVVSGETTDLTKDLDKDMRPEEFTAIKEARVRALGAEVISVDKSYKPTVSTWGMFPRPENISKTYGGGKNIAPGQELESEEAKVQRDKEVAAQLKSYRRKLGLDIDPEVAKEFQALYDDGLELLNKGNLAVAYKKFSKAGDMVDFKTKLGGEARYQKALCLDSSGQNLEAKSIYQSLTRHPNSGVRKQAKRMLFGFQAMDDLKTHTISYSANAESYRTYFRKFTSDWDTVYFDSSSGEGSEEDFGAAFLLSGTLILLPVFLILVLSRF